MSAYTEQKSARHRPSPFAVCETSQTPPPRRPRTSAPHRPARWSGLRPHRHQRARGWRPPGRSTHRRQRLVSCDMAPRMHQGAARAPSGSRDPHRRARRRRARARIGDRGQTNLRPPGNARQVDAL